MPLDNNRMILENQNQNIEIKSDDENESDYSSDEIETKSCSQYLK